MTEKTYKAVLYGDDPHDQRWAIVDSTTGELLDDAQGYGYRSPQKAYAAYAYKTRDRSKDKEKEAQKKVIQNWMKENKDFVKMMDRFAFEIAKGSWAPDDKFDTQFVRGMLKEAGYTDLPFTAKELLQVWQKG